MDTERAHLILREAYKASVVLTLEDHGTWSVYLRRDSEPTLSGLPTARAALHALARRLLEHDDGRFDGADRAAVERVAREMDGS